MANRRMIYQDFFEDDYFGTREYGMRILWIGLIAAAADDQGRILYNTSLIRAKVFMYDDTSNSEVEDWITELAKDNKIVIYVADGKHLIQIAKWWDYQTPSWASESKYPAPPNWTDRIKCHVTGGTIKNVNWDQRGGLRNGIHSALPNLQGRPINDVKLKDDINDNSDDELEGSKIPQTGDLFEDCKVIYETKKQNLVTDPKSFSQMITEFKANGVIPQDYVDAIDAMDADPDYTGSKPTSYKNWTINNAQRRLNPRKPKLRATDPKAIAEHDDLVKNKLVEELSNV